MHFASLRMPLRTEAAWDEDLATFAMEFNAPLQFHCAYDISDWDAIPYKVVSPAWCRLHNVPVHSQVKLAQSNRTVPLLSYALDIDINIRR